MKTAAVEGAEAASSFWPRRPPGVDGMADTIEDVLFGRATAVPIPDHQPSAQIRGARTHFRVTRSQLSSPAAFLKLLA